MADTLDRSETEVVMKRVLLLSLLATLIASSFAAPVQCQDPPKVLLFIRGGSIDWAFMLTQEVGVMRRVLEDNGIDVAVATVSGEPISVGSITLVPDLKLSDVNSADYAGFILPCMAASSYVATGAVEMVREAAAAEKFVAAQYGSVVTLAEAGLLAGKQYAYRVEMDTGRYPLTEGAIYGGNGVVRDGNIITSGLCPYMSRQLGVPDRTEELSQALVDAIKSND